MKLTALIILTHLFFFSGSILGQIEADTSGSAVVIGKEVFRDIIVKLAERNSFQEDATALMEEVDVMDRQIVLKENMITRLKQDNENLVKQLFDCNDRPFYDTFFWGFAGAAAVIVVGVTIGALIKF